MTRMPFTLRLLYHGAHAALIGGMILIGGWVAFVPATAAESEALGAPPAQDRPQGLYQMRTAQALMKVTPDRAYVAAADVLGPDVTPLMVRLGVIFVASGGLGPKNGPLPATAPPAQPQGRTIEGPRFIQVD